MCHTSQMHNDTWHPHRTQRIGRRAQETGHRTRNTAEAKRMFKSSRKTWNKTQKSSISCFFHKEASNALCALSTLCARCSVSKCLLFSKQDNKVTNGVPMHEYNFMQRLMCVPDARNLKCLFYWGARKVTKLMATQKYKLVQKHMFMPGKLNLQMFVLGKAKTQKLC